MSDPVAPDAVPHDTIPRTEPQTGPFHGEAVSPFSPIKGVVNTLFTRKWSILLIALMVELGIGVSVFWLLVSTYESKARLNIDLSTAVMPVMASETSMVSDIEKMAFFETVVQEIETPSLIEGVVAKLGLDKRRKIGRIEWLMDRYKGFKRSLGYRFGIESWKEPPDPFGAAVNAVIDNLSTARLENSTILELVYSAKDGKECQETLTAVVDSYLEYRSSFIRDKATGGAKFLEVEIERVRKELDGLEGQVLGLMREEAMPLIGSSWNGSDNGSAHEVIGMLSNPAAVEQMMLRLLSLQEELERVIADGRGSHPTVKLMLELIDVYLEAVNKAPFIQQRLHALQRELLVKEHAYNQLISTLESTKTMASADLGRLNAIKVVQFASPSGVPVGPQRTMAMISGLVLGLVLGVIYALVKEFMDTTIKSPEDVRNRLGLELIISLKKR